ncbi:MAG: hypothetical protein QW292_04775 [Candidatus Parvarchaeota archaeon]
METAIFMRIHASYANSIRKSRVNSLFRKLYGYNSFSNYSRYNKKVNGLIDNIPSIRYDRSIVMIKNVDISTLEKIIRKYEQTTRAGKSYLMRKRLRDSS